MVVKDKAPARHRKGEANPDLTVNLKLITPEQVAELVKTYPHLWLKKVLPAIVKGVFDGAEWLCWNYEGPNPGGLATSLVMKLNNRERVRRWLS